MCLHGELVKAPLLKAKHATQTPVVSSRSSLTYYGVTKNLVPIVQKIMYIVMFWCYWMVDKI